MLCTIVTEKIANIPYFIPETRSFSEFLNDGVISYIGQRVWEQYYNVVLAEAVDRDVVAKASLNVVYTPLCGTGNEPVREIFHRLGVNTTVVEVQEKPDGDFKTCEYPNPETDAALNESYKVAQRAPCDVILGTDPDCDRVAIAVPFEGGFRKLSGNELGCLLMDYILSALQQKNRIPENAMVVRSLVSSPLADRIAEHYGVDMNVVLTGFKYIGGEILKLEQVKQEYRYLFGFEESCGYLKGTYCRDKDAVVASMLVCELAASLKLRGKTILEALDDLYQTYGQYLAHVCSLELTGADAMQKAAKLMSDLRENAPEKIAGLDVTCINDYLTRESVDKSGIKTAIQLPKSNVLEYILGRRGSVIVRPSGTEPKVKYYFTAVAETKSEAQKMIDLMVEQLA